MLQALLVNTEETTDVANEQETHVRFTLGDGNRHAIRDGLAFRSVSK